MNELIEKLKKYTIQYALENGIVLEHNNFLRCLSPEHEDRNPSMRFWEENNIFHCFSCGANYDIFSLANLLEGKPLNGPEFITENVFYLAQRYGEPYEHLKKQLTAEEIQKYIYIQTMKTFTQYILKNKNKEYLEKRKITEETAQNLLIGSVKSFNDCINYMKENGCNEDVIKQIGITKFKVNENKMIFIIKDEWGRPVSFVSREMVDLENQPKYINGDATIIFNKSKIFYLWSDIKKEYNSMKTLIIVEGYIDAITAYQFGYRQIVALGSASFTDDHIKIIENNSKIEKVSVALDNDKIGKQRMGTLIDRIKEQKTNKEYKFAVYKESGKDIDQILNEHGQKVDLFSIFELKSLFDYELMNIKESLGEELDESVLFDRFVKVIAKTKRPKDREEQARTLSGYLTQYSYNTILEEIKYIISEDENKYKEALNVMTDRVVKEIKKKPEYVEGILNEFSENIKELNIKYKKGNKSLFDEAIDNFDSFESDKKNFNLFNCNFGIPALNDLDIYPGDILILGALPNVGKSTFFQKIAKNAIIENDNVVLIYVTPDDPAEKVYSNLIASMSGLPREYCKNPYYHKGIGLNSGHRNAMKYYEVYSAYKEKLREYILNKKIIIWDVKNGIAEWRNLENKINRLSQDKDLENKYKLLVCDPVNKIEVEGATNDNEAIGLLSSRLKKVCENNKIMACLNFELNKLRNNTKLSSFNLSGSKRMFYDANVLLFMYNPTRNLQEYAGTENETKLKWNLEINGNVYKQPILFTIQEKSKNGNEEMNAKPYFYKLNTFTSDLEPINILSDEHRKYEEIWYDEWTRLYTTYRT